MNKNKKDKKKYYCKNINSKNKRNEELAESIVGILITTDKNKEKNCVKDTYNILNDAVEHLYPEFMKKLNEPKEIEKNIPNVESSANDTEKINADDDKDELIKVYKKQKLEGNNNSKITDVSNELENELKHLRTNKTKFFYNFETNCKGVIFIKIDKTYKKELDVKRIAKYIINKVKHTKEQISRNISRFVPVEIAFKAKFDLFVKNAPLVLDKYFLPVSEDIEKRISWKLEFKARNNTSINKTEFLDFVINYIDKNRYYVDYKTPELIVLIEITNDLLCLSVLEDYYENKCYNLMTLSKSEEELQNEREKLMKMQSDREMEKKMLREKNSNTDREVNINKDEQDEILSGDQQADVEAEIDDEEEDIQLI